MSDKPFRLEKQYSSNDYLLDDDEFEVVMDGNSIHTGAGEELFDTDRVRGIKDELFEE